jgi:hypothetical protein
MGWLLKLLTGGLVEKFTGPLLDAYRAKLNAANDAERIAADVDIARLEGLRSIAMAEAADRWSATRIGRLLIVLPWAVWWFLIFAVSIINGLFGTTFVIYAVPADIREMALILIPAIVIADAGALIARRK